MPSLAFSVLRPDFARSIGFYEEFTTTTNITTTTSVVSTALRDLGYTNDDPLIGRWIYIKGSNNDRLSRLINDYTGSSGTIAIRGETLASESGSTNCELMPYSPARLKTILNDAREEAFPHLFLPVENETLVTGFSPLRKFTLPSAVFIGAPTMVQIGRIIDPQGYADNIISDLDPGFESPTGSDHTATSITVTEESETTSPRNYMVLTGSNSAKCVAVLNTAGTYYQRFTNSGNFDGEELNLFVWAYSRTSGRISASIDSGSQSDGSTHGGTGWEKMRHTEILGDPSTVDVGVAVTSGAVFPFYVDSCVVIAGPSEIAERIYDTIPRTWYNYYRPLSTNTDGTLEFLADLPAQRSLRIHGKYYLSSVDAEANTMELDDQQANLLYAYGRKILYEEEYNKSVAGSAARGEFRELLAQAHFDIESEKRNLLRRNDRPPIRIGLGVA